MERIKKAVTTRTIQIALGALVVCVITMFLPWLAQGRRTMSLAELLEEGDERLDMVPVMLTVGFLWMVIFYLLRFPKIALAGILPLAFIWMAVYMAADQLSGVNLGLGAYLYMLMLIVCIVASFLTRIKPKNPAGNPPGNYPPGTQR